jgi:hypothetical protein
MFALLNRLLHRRRPGRRLPRREGRPRLQVEHLEDRQLLSVVTNPANNPIIPNVQVETVFWGSVWSSGEHVTGYQNINGTELATEATDLNQFFRTITSSPYMCGLSQYTGGNGAPGSGQFIGTDFVAGLNPNLNNPANWTPISDQQIQGMLQTEMINRIPHPDGNKVYFVFLPPGVGTTGDVGQNGKLDGGGHHFSFPTAWGTAYCAVIEHPLSGFFPSGLTVPATRLQQLTYVASHELVEAVTDPMGNAWANWSQSPAPEIGDITQNQPPPGGTMAMEDSYLPAGEGYLVQKYWSELGQTSIAPGGTAFQPLQNLPSLGGQFVLESEQNGQTVRIDLVLGSLLGGPQPGVESYQAFWGPTAVGAVATVSLDGSSDKLQIVVTANDGSTLFQGSISVPENDWRMTDEMEVSGTVYQPNGAFYAFAVAEAPTFVPGVSAYGGSGGSSFSTSSFFATHRVMLA